MALPVKDDILYPRYTSISQILLVQRPSLLFPAPIDAALRIYAMS
jgi:hypothetical protein